MWICGSLWLSMLVYNVISALFGICRIRRVYVELLQTFYRVRLQVCAKFSLFLFFTTALPRGKVLDE